MKLVLFNNTNMPKGQAFYWSPMMIEMLKENYELLTAEQFEAAFGIDKTNVRTQLYSMGMKKIEMEYWTPEQVQYLLNNYRNIGDSEMAMIFQDRWPKNKKWTIKHIEKKRVHMKLRRTKEDLVAIKLRNRDRGCWNKIIERMNNIRRKTKLWDVVTWSVHSRPILVIKTEKGFEHYAPWLYKKEFGPVPEGHVVITKDGNRMNIVKENLLAVSRSEACRRVQGYSKEISDTINLLRLLSKTIKQKQNVKA